ncbi:MAG: type I-C CRISPR-associated protein Cas5c [Thermomicrobiales bacterium]
MTHIPLEVTVWGGFACFTRPELKVERVTYPVMTPTAARGVLEAIFWKPEFRWNVREIVVAKPIEYVGIMRNEVNNRASERSARAWEKAGIGGFVASEDRAQRNTLALKNVRYVIRADIDVRPGVDAHEAKYRDQFRRRVERGQCFAQPYLGCREFSAFFAEPTDQDTPLDLSMGLGRMLLDLDYADDRSGDARPRFFDAHLDRGVMRVPRTSGEIGGRDAA